MKQKTINGLPALWSDRNLGMIWRDHERAGHETKHSKAFEIELPKNKRSIRRIILTTID